MSMRNESDDPKAAVRELLLEDFRYFTTSFWNNEQIGETRVNWFLGIVAAGVGGLFSLVGLEHRPPPHQLRLMITVCLLALFSFGLVTLFRIIKRNENTDGYKLDCDRIRWIFSVHFDDAKILANYLPTKPVDSVDRNSVDQKRKFGGLAHIVLMINSLLIAGVVGASIYPFGKNESLAFTYLAGALALVVAFTAQHRYVDKRDKKKKGELKAKLESEVAELKKSKAKNELEKRSESRD